VSTVSPAISSRVLTRAVSGAATTAVQNMAVGVVFLLHLRAVLWSCSSAVSTGLGLRRWRGSVAVVGPPGAGRAAAGAEAY
jgi:hypothetical protein